MAYRNPAFLLNKLPAFGTSVITASAALVEAFSKALLIDGRTNRVCARSGNGALELFWDLPSAITLDALVIPAGHTLNGADLEVKTYPSAAHSGGTVRSSGTVASAAAIERTWSPVSSQWWSLNIPTTSNNWALPEVILGEKKTTTSGVVPAWDVGLFDPVEVFEFAKREATVRRAPPRRELQVEHQRLPAADLAIYDAVLAVGRAEPFWHWPVDDTLPGMLVKIVGQPSRTQDSPHLTAAGLTYGVRMTLREQVT